MSILVTYDQDSAFFYFLCLSISLICFSILICSISSFCVSIFSFNWFISCLCLSSMVKTPLSDMLKCIFNPSGADQVTGSALILAMTITIPKVYENSDYPVYGISSKGAIWSSLCNLHYLHP